MGDPTTRPGEFSRIAALAGDDPYRTEVLVMLIEQRERGKRHEQWMKDHDRVENMRFSAIEGKLSGAVSGVDDYHENMAQVAGARKLVIGVVAVIAALGGCILFALELLSRIKP